MAQTNSDEIINQYSAFLVDGDFTTDFTEDGGNRVKSMTPMELDALYRLQRRQRADSQRDKQGMYHKICD